jgi:hypothetical protein
LPKVIFVVYIHVHYSIYVIYLWILKLYHARPCAHARLCMLFLKKIPGVSRSDKLIIIQLLEADLNQVLLIAFARNIGRLAKEHEGIISKHQYGRAHKTCMTPVLNKLLTVQLIIQKRIEGIVFDNDAQGCYDRIISGIALAYLMQIGYSKNST